MTARQSNLLGALVLAVGDRMNEATRDEADRGGRRAAALCLLAQQDALGIEGLRRQLALSQPATVRLVDALVADGLATRRDGRDRRSVVVELTRAGHARAHAVLAARRAVLDQVLRPLAAADRAYLEELLELVLGGLTADAAEGGVICRLCDVAACPQASCPVECAIAASR